MSRVLVTGADGFVGRSLLEKLLSVGLNGREIEEVIAFDTRFGTPAQKRVTQLVGDLAKDADLDRLLDDPIDAVFHLASILGGAAERDHVAARRVNLDATLALLERLGTRRRAARFVFASTIAVYGSPLPDIVDEATPAAPQLSYGAQKLMGEIAVADATRRGWVRGCSVRLPAIVARPGDGTGLISSFMSQVFWSLRDGVPITLPVTPEGRAWWISVGACADNLLHAASDIVDRLPVTRVVQMPALHLSMAEVVAGLVAALGTGREKLVTYSPDPFVQANFASYPPLATPFAESIDFTSDGQTDVLIQRALSGC